METFALQAFAGLFMVCCCFSVSQSNSALNTSVKSSAQACMRTIRFIPQDVTARWPVVQDAKPETVGTVKKAAAKLLVKRCGFCKRLVVTMNENRDMTLFLVLCLVVLRKLVRCCDQQLLKIGGGNLAPVVDVGERLFVADPISHAIGADVRPNAALAPIIYHPIFWHFVKRVRGLMHQANCPEVV